MDGMTDRWMGRDVQWVDDMLTDKKADGLWDRKTNSYSTVEEYSRQEFT